MSMSRRVLVVIALFSLLLLGVTHLSAMWAYIDGRDLLEKTDLIVIAELTDASEVTANGVDYGRGVLEVQRVLYPSGDEIDSLLLRWKNTSGLVCPRVDPGRQVGAITLWLLTRSEDGTVRADYPRRMIRLDELSALERFVSEAWPLSGDEHYDARVLALDNLLRTNDLP